MFPGDPGMGFKGWVGLGKIELRGEVIPSRGNSRSKHSWVTATFPSLRLGHPSPGQPPEVVNEAVSYKAIDVGAAIAIPERKCNDTVRFKAAGVKAHESPKKGAL